MNELCKTHVDACRFCWMCRHICPIGNATGLERNTARARALGLSLVNRGTFTLSDVIDNVYECACCGGCTNDCATGFDPVMFIRAARLDAALGGILPDYIAPLVDNCLDIGNPYGKTETDAVLKKAIDAHAEKTDTVLFLGTDARYMASGCAVKAIKAVEKTGVPFTVLPDEKPSGAALDYLIGAADETKKQAEDCAASLAAFDTVIVYDPADAVMLKRRYKEYGVAVKPKIVTFTAFLADKLDALKPEKKDMKVVYQDPFALSRDLGETEEPRKIIRAYAELSEMLVHGKDTIWAGGILQGQWMADVMKAVASRRLDSVKSIGVDTVVTASVSEYMSMKAATRDDVTVLSVEELIFG